MSVLVNDGSGAFLPRVDYLVGAGAYGIATGDFDGNGSRDLVSVDSLTVLLNRGNAIFDARSDYPAGAAPRALAFGDLDGDKRLDLVAVNSTEFTNSSNTVSVFRNTGGQGFAPGVSYATGKRPNSVALGDFDGDGKLDIATANLTDGTVSVLLNYGNGTFAPRVDHPSGNLSASLVAGDLNADGKVDIAVSSSPDIWILFNRGNATFSSVSVVTYAIATLSSPRAIAMGDLNGDGRPDLARIELKGDFGGNYPGWATVLNQGGGSFVRSQWTFASAWTNAIAIGALGGGGSNSIVVANENNTVTAGGANYPTTGSLAKPPAEIASNPESAADLIFDGMSFVMSWAQVPYTTQGEVFVNRSEQPNTPFKAVSVDLPGSYPYFPITRARLALGPGASLSLLHDYTTTQGGPYDLRLLRFLIPPDTSSTLTPITNSVRVLERESSPVGTSVRLVRTGGGLLAIWIDSRWGQHELYARPLDLLGCP